MKPLRITLYVILFFSIVSCSNMIEDYLGGKETECIPRNAVGATDSTTLRTLDFTPGDDNSIFVSKLIGNDDIGTGTQSNPVASINKAITLCDAQRQRVVILDSETYEEEGLEFAGDFKGLYAHLGTTPTFKPLINNNFVDTTDTEELTTPTEFEANDCTLTDSTVLLNGNVFLMYRDSSVTHGKFCIVNKDGVIIIEPQVFSDSAGASYCATMLQNGNAFIIYTSDRGYFQILDPSGNTVLGEKPFHTSPVTFGRVVTLQNGNVFLTFLNPDTYSGYYCVISQTGSIDIPPTEFVNKGITYNGPAALLNGNIFIAYRDEYSVGEFCILSPIGDKIVDPTVFDTGVPSNQVRSTTLRDGNALVAYTTGAEGRFCIISPTGTILVSPKKFDTSVFRVNVATLADGNAVIVYGETASNKGKFCIINPDGEEVLAAVEFEDSNIQWPTVSGLLNGNVFMAYGEMGDSDKGKFTIWYPYSWAGIKVLTDNEINGLIIDINKQGGAKRLIDVNANNLNISYCDIKGCTEPGNKNVSGYAIYSNNDINVSNCKIYDNHNGIYIESNRAQITDSQFYRNISGYALQINGAAVDYGDIIINHCDLFNNYGGIRLENNGSNEIINNSIFHRNSDYGIYADNQVTLTNSICTDSVLNTMYGTQVMETDPLYIDEGETNPDDIDLHIQVRHLGYPVDSPAKWLANDGRNAGSWDVEYVGR